MPSKRIPVALLAATLGAASARADEPGPPKLSFSGFGTLGVAHSSESEADFTSSFFKASGAGHSHDWSPAVDSLLAAQLTARPLRKLSVVLQVVSEQNHDGTYWPHVEWANIRYQLTPDFSLRAGRVVMPSFMASDARQVGYANPGVRPPVEVYGVVPITANDGVDASYRRRFGEVATTLQGFYGRTKSTNPDGTRTTARDQWGVFDTLERGPLTVRVGYHQAHLTLEALQPFFATFRRFGPEGTAIADRYVCGGKLIPFGTVGASYDPGRWSVAAEWARTNSHCFIGERTAWYVSAGVRWGRLTPSLVYAQTTANSRTSDPGLSLAGLPADLAGPIAGLNAALNGILGSVPDQKTISLRGRWDFAKNAAFKLQLDHARLGAGSQGTLVNLQPGFQAGGHFNLVSATIDFVF